MSRPLNVVEEVLVLSRFLDGVGVVVVLSLPFLLQVGHVLQPLSKLRARAVLAWS